MTIKEFLRIKSEKDLLDSAKRYMKIKTPYIIVWFVANHLLRIQNGRFLIGKINLYGDLTYTTVNGCHPPYFVFNLPDGNKLSIKKNRMGSYLVPDRPISVAKPKVKILRFDFEKCFEIYKELVNNDESYIEAVEYCRNENDRLMRKW